MNCLATAFWGQEWEKAAAGEGERWADTSLVRGCDTRRKVGAGRLEKAQEGFKVVLGNRFLFCRESQTREVRKAGFE